MLFGRGCFGFEAAGPPLAVADSSPSRLESSMLRTRTVPPCPGSKRGKTSSSRTSRVTYCRRKAKEPSRAASSLDTPQSLTALLSASSSRVQTPSSARRMRCIGTGASAQGGVSAKEATASYQSSCSKSANAAPAPTSLASPVSVRCQPWMTSVSSSSSTRKFSPGAANAVAALLLPIIRRKRLGNSTMGTSSHVSLISPMGPRRAT
mmetsp:Transcript_32346/g.68924  ORF Transcript_32346/g.68924 Transcript_32346/m.68924 type:complete len:207 (-) Transcript_32346:694-1314(-)